MSDMKKSGGPVVDWVLIIAATIGLGAAIYYGLSDEKQEMRSSPAPAEHNIAATKDDRYSLTICNNHSDTIFVAYARRVKSTDTDRTLAGWRGIKAGQCSTLFKGRFGQYSNANVYYYAEDGGDYFWGGGDKSIRLCVNTDAFERMLSGNYTCRSDQRSELFGRIEISSENPDYELTLN